MSYITIQNAKHKGKQSPTFSNLCGVTFFAFPGKKNVNRQHFFHVLFRILHVSSLVGVLLFDISLDMPDATTNGIDLIDSTFMYMFNRNTNVRKYKNAIM